jgi:pyruvate/2-oxoacid:ferredoxin oxidoreductase alpha subunit/NAD-dependent dihydropyrimidine dehydrogenase PreA subunit
MTASARHAKPLFRPECCKACERCVEACARGCLTPGAEVHALSGHRPVTLDLEACNGCGLCVTACPEPHALALPSALHPAPPPGPGVEASAAVLPRTRPMLMKGTHASAAGAVLAGCRHFFGYPITPSTEGAELLSAVLPALGGSFLQAPSEVAAVNMMYGSAAAGLRTMTFTSSPGLSLMLEGISYLIGAELPAVIVDVMRAGPGLGNIGPEQSDVKLACRGLGHGDTHAIVLAPASPQEMLDLTLLAFELADRYRNPVLLLADAYLGQMTGKVVLPRRVVRPGVPAWAVRGAPGHRQNLIASIELRDTDQQAHTRLILEKYRRIQAAEQRAETFRCEDAELVIVAAGTLARTARVAAESLRAEGQAVGLFRPRTLWPFPVDALLPVLSRTRRLLVVEAAGGQLEDELRLAVSHAGSGPLEVERLQRHGGVLPTQQEIVEAARAMAGRRAA